jgi:molybdopterin-synthase adenylyltransferase
MQDRYARQTLLEVIGEAGQERLAAASVAVVGCGALGCTIAALVARAGVGRIRLIDRDVVEWSNLQRQILFDERHARESVPKAIAAAEQLALANSSIVLDQSVRDLHAGNVEQLLSGVDLILDGTDNLETRYLVNEAAVRSGTPWVYAASVATYGVVMPIIPGDTACLRCVFPSMSSGGGSATCDTVGVLGSIITVIGGIAAAEGLKILTGAHDRLRRGLTWIDVWYNSSQSTELSGPAANCPTCMRRQFDLLDAGPQALTARLCGRDAVQVRPSGISSLDLAQLEERLQRVAPSIRTDYLLRTSIDGYELSVFDDGRLIVKGTEDLQLARSLYARYIGL